MKNFLNEYGESIFLIILGIVVFTYIRNPESYSKENTNFIKGVLVENPKEGVHDESQDYIGLWIKGHPDFYEFTGCSYSDRIESTVKKLKKGDRISFYARKKSSSTTFPWKGKKYKTYKICDATSHEYGKIISFRQFNQCNDYKSNIFIPILCGIMVLIGVFKIIRKLKDRENIKEVESLTISATKNDATIKLRPDRLTFILRNSYYSFFLIGLGLFFNYPFDLNNLSVFGLIIFTVGVYFILQSTMIHDKIYYIVDSSGIRIKKISFLFQSEMKIVRYDSIKGVIYRQAFYESGKNIGTILIDNGEESDEGDTIYSKIIGVENYKEIAKVILRRAELSK
ncbi:hypothetical protein DMA11_12315 [Marinilabiliaceae bacterium JC017]|nr:hypothetical protein DMA11_12315 [Marinilabiliaceae bacterium JC017]